jgi:hypothetical protein
LLLPKRDVILSGVLGREGSMNSQPVAQILRFAQDDNAG